MENRRLFAFMFLSVATFWIWGQLVAPKLFPPPPKKPVPQQVDADGAKKSEPGISDDSIAAGAVDSAVAEKPADGEQASADGNGEAAPAVHPSVKVNLGSLEPGSGYALQVVLTSEGAAIEEVWLTDPQFRDLKLTDKQARVIGNNSSADRSFTTAVDFIDQQLLKHTPLSLEAVSWKLEQQTENPDGMSATFSFDSPDGRVRLEKTYHLPRIKVVPEQLRTALRSDPSGYTVRIEFKLINLSAEPQELVYEMQGPVGMLLENEEHTSKYRDIKIEFLAGGDDVTTTPKEIVSSVEEHEEQAGHALERKELFELLKSKDKWTGVFRYAGIDVQFFAALVAPLDDRSPELRAEQKLIDRTYPMIVEKDRRDDRKSDISFRMVSTPVKLEAKGGADSVSHQYAFFAGPKRRELLDPLPLAASRVLDYGSWFGFIARGMHWLLDQFYSIGMPYVLAIISLTVLVRGLLFPLSKKQAISAAKMKDLQPKLAELKLKFGDDKEKMARAQMELWRKHNINPLGGCLPLFFQFPIFIGLYTSLNTAVDLRMASFLWIENLAGPDALFRLPFELPFGLGADFSLLPCITVVLFLLQQKMFMPPALDEQQVAQQKMMNFMTIFMGVMFWHQPAGLCIYFIASSLWGIAERTMLGNTSVATATTDETSGEVPERGDDAGRPSASGKPSVKVVTPKPEASAKPPGFMQKLLEMAEEARQNAEKSKKDSTPNRKKRNR